jgi:hypothetical protein
MTRRLLAMQKKPWKIRNLEVQVMGLDMGAGKLSLWWAKRDEMVDMFASSLAARVVLIRTASEK